MDTTTEITWIDGDEGSTARDETYAYHVHYTGMKWAWSRKFAPAGRATMHGATGSEWTRDAAKAAAIGDPR